jgi:hypothetical protein
LIPFIDRIRNRFCIGRFCIVVDRGMVRAVTVKEDRREIPYILRTRMRKVNEIKRNVLSRRGRSREVRPEGKASKDPAHLKGKDVSFGGNRYIVCLNPRQARKDAQDRELIIDALREKIKGGPKTLIGNKGYRKYLKIDRISVGIDQDKVDYEARFDGK